MDPQQNTVIDLVSSDDEDEEVQEIPPVHVQRQQQQARMLQRPATPIPPRLNDQEIFRNIDFDISGAFPENDTPAPVAQSDHATLNQQTQGGEYINIDGEDVWIPDSPGHEARAAPQSNQNPSQSNYDEEVALMLNEENFTADTCLQRVLAIFPDISHEHILKLYSDFDFDQSTQSLSGTSRFESIVEKLIGGDGYPKQDKGKKKKRKREDEDEAMVKRWEGPSREVAPGYCKGPISTILKADFSDVSQQMISQFLAIHKHLYQTYVAIAHARDTESNKRWLGKPSKVQATPEEVAQTSGYAPLLDELLAARKRVEMIRQERIRDLARKKAEEQNLRLAIESGQTAECQACFEELPMNRQIHCDGNTAHFTCFECAETYVKSEVGDSRCRVLCTAGCGAGFAHAQLQQLSDKQLLQKLAQLQQEKDIREAGLDNLEECPFCDYKAILPPVEEDFEFRCANPECEKVSCRRCKAISHIPRSCEEHAKDNKLNTRHKIEEAMTAAMIRSCNKCKKQFIKEYGCNKMTCPSCGNLQCYVCSQSLKDYNHFDQGPAGGPNAARANRCPLYDNVEERHEREVKEAEAAARAQAMEDNPDVSADDLQIKVSDAVDKATQDRIRRAGGGPGAAPGAGLGGLFGMHHHLHHGLEDDEADDDEDFDDEDLADFNWLNHDMPILANLRPPLRQAPQLGQPARARIGERMRRLGLGERFGDRLLRNMPLAPGDAQRQLGAQAQGPGQAQAPPQAQPQYQAQQAVVPDLNAARPQLQGFIPVFGLGGLNAPAAPQQQAAQPQPVPNQPNAVGHPLGGFQIGNPFYQQPHPPAGQAIGADQPHVGQIRAARQQALQARAQAAAGRQQGRAARQQALEAQHQALEAQHQALVARRQAQLALAGLPAENAEQRKEAIRQRVREAREQNLLAVPPQQRNAPLRGNELPYGGIDHGHEFAAMFPPANGLHNFALGQPNAPNNGPYGGFQGRPHG